MTFNFKEIAETLTCWALMHQLPGNNLSSEIFVEACWAVGFLFYHVNIKLPPTKGHQSRHRIFRCPQ